jgi:hypothetical protein
MFIFFYFYSTTSPTTDWLFSISSFILELAAVIMVIITALCYLRWTHIERSICHKFLGSLRSTVKDYIKNEKENQWTLYHPLQLHTMKRAACSRIEFFFWSSFPFLFVPILITFFLTHSTAIEKEAAKAYLLPFPYNSSTY